MTLYPKRHRVLGALTGLCPVSGQEAELKDDHCPSKWPGNETKTYKINTSFLQLKSKIKQ